MSSEMYAIVFKGDVLSGYNAATVQAQLAELLKLNPKKVKTLFSGKQIILKRTYDKSEALKYGKVLKQVGADIKIRVTHAKPADEGASESPAEGKTTEPNKTDSKLGSEGLTLAPNVGDLFDPITSPKTPDLDLSEYSVAENDGSYIFEPVEITEVNLDLSSYSIADNDGRDLFITTEPVDIDIKTPDFGLAKAGALLETLQVEQEILNPDTAGITLAAAGTDLLEENEKRNEQTEKKPDTSKLNLAPNFDI